MIDIQAHPEPNPGESQRGFSLIELIIVIVLLGIMSAYAVTRNMSPGLMTVQSQVQAMASDIRRAQTLAAINITRPDFYGPGHPLDNATQGGLILRHRKI